MSLKYCFDTDFRSFEVDVEVEVEVDPFTQGGTGQSKSNIRMPDTLINN